jgi:DNA-binding NarL/FixJ family response regulator
MSTSMHSAAIQLAVIEDDLGLREHLKQWAERHAGLKCIGTFATAEEAILALRSCRPDVWLVDINLPGQSGIAFVSQLCRSESQAKVLMLTAYEDSERIFEALKAGATGYLLKRHAAKQLLPAIQQLHQGGAPMSPEIARQVVAHFHQNGKQESTLDTLTPRERVILDSLSKGYPYKEIASSLDISLDTVRTHLRRIYEKLHVHSRTEAVVKYLRS